MNEWKIGRRVRKEDREIESIDIDRIGLRNVMREREIERDKSNHRE